MMVARCAPTLQEHLRFGVTESHSVDIDVATAKFGREDKQTRIDGALGRCITRIFQQRPSSSARGARTKLRGRPPD